jgi:hypothetical protein
MYADPLQRCDHRRSIVIAEYAQDSIWRPHRGHNVFQALDQWVQRRMDIVSDVARNNAKIAFDSGNTRRGFRCRVIDVVEVKIGQVKNTVTVERRRKVCERQRQLGQFQLKSSLGTAPKWPRRAQYMMYAPSRPIEVAAQLPTPTLA